MKIALWLALTIVLASTTALAANHAHQESVRADVAEHALADTTAELGATKASLGDTASTLSTTKQRLTSVSRSLNRTAAERNALSKRMRACRYLVKVNDHLLYGSVAYQKATGFLIQKHPNMRAAKHSVGNAARHATAVIHLVKRAGYRNISTLVSACAPAG